MAVVVCIISFLYLLVARLLLFLSNGEILEDSRLIVQPSRSVTLLCRASGVPRWFTTADLLVSMGNTDQVYQDKVNSTTQRLHIRSYGNLSSTEYICKSNVQSQELQRSIILTAGKAIIAVSMCFI